MLYQMCYLVENKYLADPVLANMQRLQDARTSRDFYPLAAILVVASECMMNPSALEPIEVKFSYPGHPYTILFRVYAIDGYEAIFACPQHPLSFKVIYFGHEMEESERLRNLLGDLKLYWSE